MAIFGKNIHGAPLGAIRPDGFFDQQGHGVYSYSGFSSRDGRLGPTTYSNYSGFSAYCGLDSPVFLPWKPTLVYPLNYVVVLGAASILWMEANPGQPCGDAVTYEIQFTRSFSRGTGWRTIAMDLPQGTSSFVFDFGEVPATADAGIRIRARTSANLCSDWSTSLVPFTVSNHPPSAVSLMAPLGRETIDNSVMVVWREATVRDIDGNQVFYRVQITPTSSSDSGWVTVPGAEQLVEGTVTFTVNTFDFPEGNDYGVRVVPYDELGADGTPSAAGSITIRHNGNFFVDTLPPQGALSINGGDSLAVGSVVRLDLFAADASSGVKDVRFRNYDETCWSDWQPYSPSKFWNLSPGDGIKRILVQYRDYADNVSEACDCEVVSRVLCDEGNATDLGVLNGKLYASFDKNGNLVEYRILSKQAAQFAQPQLTALAMLGGFLWVAAYNPTPATTVLYQFDGTPRQAIAGIPGKALTMVGYNSKLYMGMDDGKIREVSGSSMSISYAAATPIERLRTDGVNLFAALQSGGTFLVFDGTTWTVMSL